MDAEAEAERVASQREYYLALKAQQRAARLGCVRCMLRCLDVCSLSLCLSLLVFAALHVCLGCPLTFYIVWWAVHARQQGGTE